MWLNGTGGEKHVYRTYQCPGLNDAVQVKQELGEWV